MDEKGVEEAVQAFFMNDPYYPRPGQPLWKGFREQYLQVSSRIISREQNDRRTLLPKDFIRKVEEEQRQKDKVKESVD